jgi:hypothetical protein
MIKLFGKNPQTNLAGLIIFTLFVLNQFEIITNQGYNILIVLFTVLGFLSSADADKLTKK